MSFDEHTEDTAELISWVNRDDIVRAALLSKWKGISFTDKDATVALRGRGLVDCFREGDSDESLTLTPLGRRIAGYIAQHVVQDEVEEIFQKMPLSTKSIFLDLGVDLGDCLSRLP